MIRKLLKVLSAEKAAAEKTVKEAAAAKDVEKAVTPKDAGKAKSSSLTLLLRSCGGLENKINFCHL